MSNGVLIFKRNLTIYVRERQYVFDLVVPLIAWIILFSAKKSKNPALFVLSEDALPLTFLGVTRGVATNLINEKSARHKEIQKIMGISQFDYVLGWLMTNMFRLMAVVVPFLILVLSTQVLGDQPGLTILGLLLFGFSSLSLAYFISVFFDNPLTGGNLIVLLNILGIIFTQLLNLKALSEHTWISYILAVIPSFAYGALNFNNTLAKAAPIGTTYIFANKDAYYMLGADTLIYLIAYLYFDQVIKNEYGTQKSALFIFGVKKESKESTKYLEMDMTQLKQPLRNSFSDFQDHSSAIYHEPFDNTAQCKRSVQIEGLFKKFKQVQAVNGVSLSLYENQILTLLGHNGAGKTTLISLLTGLIEKDQGLIRFYGESIDDRIEQVRRYTGICPQRDVYYDSLTIEEHLAFFARVKGISEQNVDSEVDMIINKCALSNERGKFAKDLSGGNRRKLCLGMAVIGGSKVIFLDEPTSGMDPVSRRTIWDILKQLKQDGKSLILTTHHLDEAEVLSERIAVMAKGKLLTVGSTNFVKKNFGIGYNLNVFYNGESQQDWRIKAEKIKKLILSTVPDSKLNPQSGEMSLAFSLAFNSKEYFIDLFKSLEEDPSITVDLYMNTLEEAFINIGIDEEKFMKRTRRYSIGESPNEDAHIEVQAGHNAFTDFSSIVAPECIKHSPSYSFWLQFQACFLRRWYEQDAKKLAVMMIFPFLFLILSTAFALVNRDFEFWALITVLSVSEGVILSFTFIAGQSGGNLVMERELKLKYALNVMGCRYLPYWLGTLAFDFILSQLLVFLFLICIFAFSIYPLQEAGSVIGVICFSFSFLTLSYLLQWVFANYLKATRILTIMLMMIQYLIPFLLIFVFKDNKSILYVALVLLPGMPIIECKSFINKLVFLINSGQDYELTNSYILLCVLMIIQGLVLFALTIAIENKTKSNKNNQVQDAVNIDVDVIEEIARVENPQCQDRVKAIKIAKSFSNGFQAVKGTSFGIEAGQILGLLGPNGAGKSTTFNMLTASLQPTSGNVLLMDQQVRKGDPSIFQNVGICPQFDCLWKIMTPPQHLKIFGLIKGLSIEETDQAVDYFIKVMQLSDFTNTPSDKLSGGNKRKLCVATALIGGTNMQFFDEPSSGVDPIARRFLWNTIQQGLKLQKGAVVLTTHTMDEAESLCHKIAIQVNGRFACIGTPQYLKQKYGSGYRATVDLVSEDKKDVVTKKIVEQYPNATILAEAVNSRLSFKIPQVGFRFSSAFDFFLNDLQRSQGLIKDFQINQSSLEQVFLYFASKQEILSPEEQAPKQKKRKCFG